MFINIVTPCSRPNNIEKIYESICIPLENYHWYIVLDMDFIPKGLPTNDNITYVPYRDANSLAGNSQRNLALELISGDYVYFLDDDTIMHSDFWNTVSGYSYDVIVFNQAFKDGSLRLFGGHIGPKVVDTGNVLIRRDTIGDIRWDVKEYNADGYFLRDVSKMTKSKKYIPKIISYYNKLK